MQSDQQPFPRRRLPDQNIVSRLRDRETGQLHGIRTSSYYASRRLHQNVVPNFTCINIEKPSCFIRKFTPDGRFLLAFSADQTAVELYEYRGPAAAEHLLVDCSGDTFEMNGDNESTGNMIRSQVFETMFRLKFSISITQNSEQLNRECSLFTDDCRFVIIGSACFLSEESQTHYFDVYRNNESVSLSSRVPLEDYTLYLIDMQNGRLCDKRVFKNDKIYLSHNQGLYLYGNTLAILSVQHQQIHLFHIEIDPILDEGKFVNVRTIGRFCYEDDEFLISSVSSSRSERRPHRSIRPFRETSINSLKHRFLTFLYWDAHSDRHNSSGRLRRFYQNFDQLCALRMWKMQLLDENHLLIKYAHEDVITMRLTDLNSPPSFFVVYDITSTNVIAVYENTSPELLDIFEQMCDYFRNTRTQSLSQLTCSPSNNLYSREIQQRYKQTMINARKGGYSEAVKRLLAQLPISAQSFTCTPYLDLSLFR